jgi:hypothetical protein
MRVGEPYGSHIGDKVASEVATPPTTPPLIGALPIAMLSIRDSFSIFLYLI